MQIGLYFGHDNGNGDFKIDNIVLTLGPCNEIAGVQVFRFQTEIQLLKAYFALLIKYNPDITTGFNIFGFDDKYIRTRTNIYKQCDEELLNMELQSSRVRTGDLVRTIFLEYQKDGSNIGYN